MISGVFSTLGAKSSNQRRLEIVTNNIANALTPGFKASRPIVNATSVGDPVEPGQLQQEHVNVADSYVHFSDAPLVETGNPLDLAIEGSGFFVVSTPNGNMYTRNGQFTLNKEKKLVTMDGNPVLGESGGDMTVEGKDVKIEVDGSLYVDGIRTGAIKVVDFADKRNLRNVGRSLFANTGAENDGSTPERFSVRQGSYEASNVDVMREMVEMISALRAFESYSRVDQSFGEVLSKLIDLGRF